MSATLAGNETEGMHWDPETGRLRYEFWSAQREALSAYRSGEYDIVVLLGGYGAGKTILGGRLTISLAMENPGSKHLANAIDFQKGDETTFETLFEQLPGSRTHILTSDWNGPEQSPIVADYNRQKHRMTLINDSVIRLGSADHPDSVIGDEYQSAWLDEPSKYHPNSKLFQLGLDTVPSRLRAHDPQYGQLWTMTGNGYNAAYEIVKERCDENGDSLDGWNIKVVYASNQDNPYLNTEDRAKFRRQYGGTAKGKQALHGGFAAAEGLVYDVRRDDHLASLSVYDPPEGPAEYAIEDPANGGRIVPLDREYRLFAYDQGFDPDPRVVLELGRTVDGRLVLLDEFYETRAHIDEAIRWLDTRPDGVIACEHQPEDIEAFKSAGYSAIKANKSIQPGISEVSDWLNPSDEDGNPLPPRLLIADRCEHSIREFFSYKAEHIGGKRAEDHAMDSLRYGLMAIRDGEDIGGLGFGTLSMGEGT